MRKNLTFLAILSILLFITTPCIRSSDLDEAKSIQIKSNILNTLNDPRFLALDNHKKLPILVSLYELLGMANKQKKKDNKWRYG